jgi:type I site-specific restriction endonuclease
MKYMREKCALIVVNRLRNMSYGEDHIDLCINILNNREYEKQSINSFIIKLKESIPRVKLLHL